jgi:hypothetical protein
MDNRVKIQHLVQDQVPNFVSELYPEFIQFLSDYYKSVEFPGGPVDILNNIEQYVNLKNITELTFYIESSSEVDYLDSEIQVNSTDGFPNSQGLIKIDSEIISYESKTSTSFVGCKRGFSGISSYKSVDEAPDFVTTLPSPHSTGSIVYNLHALLLFELYKKFKRQYAPGFEDVDFYSEINEKEIVAKLKDFYSSKGADPSFDVLFRLIWGSPVSIVRPRDYLIQPSDADYRISRILLVKSLQGDPEGLVNRTLFQDVTDLIPKATGTITQVEKIVKAGEEYYKLSLDYNPEIETFQFTVHPKTRITTSAGIGQTFIDVDSTLSFNNSGTLTFFDNNDVEYILTYSGKSTNQFFGLDVPTNIPLNAEIFTPDYAYAITETGEEIRVKVTGVLSDIEYDRESSYYYSDGDEIEIVSLGQDSEEQIHKSWLVNATPEYEVELLEQVSLKLNGAAQYRIRTFDPNIFSLGDVGTIKGSDGSEYEVFVIAISDRYEFDINILSQIDIINTKYTIRRGVSKVSCLNQSNLNIFSSEVQNVYINNDVVGYSTAQTNNDETYVVSSSLPTYYNTPLLIEDFSKTFSLSFSGDFGGYEINVSANGLNTGDAVYYSYNGNSGLNISEGQYFVYKVNPSTIKLATSRSNIRNNIFVFLAGTAVDNKIELLKFHEREVQPQNIIRKFIEPSVEGVESERITQPGCTGIFLNGVELLNYKSSDVIRYGPIDEIIVSSTGDQNYNVINPPIIEIDDNTGIGNTVFGTGAEAVCNVRGSLKRINIIDKGFDYIESPKITISGGNGSGAEAKCNLSKITYSITFNAGSLYEQVDIANNSIGFGTYHKFRNFEKIVYQNQDQTSIDGLINDSIYYVKLIDEFTIQLHNTFEDSISGINTVSLNDYGDGLQKFFSFEKKNVVSSIEVISEGSNYTNKTLFFDSSNISLSNNTIVYENHGYSDKEIILFDTFGVLPTGISTTSQYYVKVVDKDQFRIAEFVAVGVGSTVQSDVNYVNNRFVDFINLGTGQHTIKYTPIVVKLEAPIGVGTFPGQDFRAKIDPIFEGEIFSVSIKNKGSNYGDENIVNYNRQPEINILSGSGAQISPLVSSQGRIIDVIINNKGFGYNAPPRIDIIGDGSGAILTPVILNGQIVDVKIIEGGFNYEQVNTVLNVVASGSGAKLESGIRTWTINNVERAFQSEKINSDDGFITIPLNTNNGLQYTHSYAARELRRKLLATSIDLDGNPIYRDDIDNDNEPIKYHSPIIGWAYDGNPIYGPYGYENRKGGSVVRLSSGYKQDLKPTRPRTNVWPPGFFIEDYTFIGDGDLDVHNGRFCKTPEFPNGTYAYFASLNFLKDSGGPFNGFLKPVFPYVIGHTYKSKPISYNFNQFSSLEFFDVNESGWLRHTTPLGLLKSRTSYNGFLQPNDYAEGFTEVSNVSVGSIDRLSIVSPGDNYSVQDTIFFENEGTGGSGAYARIFEIQGREVSNIEYLFAQLKDVEFIPYGETGEFIGIGSTAHSFVAGDIVSVQNLNILSTEFSSNYLIGVSTNFLNLSTSIGDESQSGIVTYFNVTGNLKFPDLTVNDIYEINGEQIRVLNVNIEDSRIRVERSYNGTVSSGHTAGDVLSELPRKITINSGFTTTTQYLLNREYHFDPKESVIIPSENLVTYSNPVSPTLVAGAWDYYTAGIGTGSVDYYAEVSPDKTLNAAKVSFASTTGASDAFGIEFGTIGLSADYNTFSIFLKGENGGEQVYMILEDSLSYYSQLVTVTSDWKRYSLNALTSAGSHTIRIGTLGTQGLQLNSEPTVYVYGAQVELGNYTSSYYSTYGSALSRSSNESGILYFNSASKSQPKSINTIPNTFYLPKHGFNTGDLITYKVGSGYTGVTVSYASTVRPLEDGEQVYAAVYDRNTIGISTQMVGIGSTGTFVGIGSLPISLTNLIDYGTGDNHSFVTNNPLTIKGDVYKKTGKITTTVNHGLSDKDSVNVNVIVGVNTTIYVAYDDVNRRMIIDPRTFNGSDIDLSTNFININNHGFSNGQKVIYTSSSPSSGLNNSQMYYIVVIDDNNVALSNFYYEKITSNLGIELIQIGTQQPGTLSPINPELSAYRNSTVRFQLSDQTLAANSQPAFEFNLFTDDSFETEFYTTPENTGQFNIRKSGVIGEPFSYVEIIIDENVPDSLYYNLVPINYFGAAQTKVEILRDEFNIKNPNKFTILNSKFNRLSEITGVTTNTFNYSLDATPERNSYNSNEAIIKYTTTSDSAVGPVNRLSLDSIGRNYRKLANVQEVISGLGTNAIFLPASTSIGKVNEVSFTDVGFDYPSDKTLRPIANFPYTYKIEPLSKFKQIKIIDPGVNYFVPPQLAVLDGFTGRINNEAFLRYDIGDTEVSIIRNTTGLYNVIPKILPINNPNGIRIDNIVFDSGTLDVTVSLAVTFSSLQDFPFKVGEKIIVENTNIEIGSGQRGFNSAAYEYKLFTITEADLNLSGDFPFVKYNLSDVLKPGEFPGIFDNFESFGTITPESYFPIFDITLEKDSFRSGEIITSQDGNVGIVQVYDVRNEYLKVRSRVIFKVDDLIIGNSSQNQGLISSVEGISGKYIVGSNSIIKRGWLKDTGKLNESFQRIHDNEYYQYFSYSVRSPISYEEWNPLVSNLNHTAGYKKFAELTVESYDPTLVGINTDQNLNTLDAVSDLTEIVDLNTVKDFDIAREKSITVDDSLVSNEILFNLPFLARYQEFIGNRVLPIDDISDQFNGTNRQFEIRSGGYKVFENIFDGSDGNLISFADSTINLRNHYFVSGEEIEYIPPSNDFSNAIQIEPSDFGPGIGTTTFLPSRFIVVKQDNQKIRVATSATNALLFNPVSIGLTGVGIGTSHIFRSLLPNNRLLVTINGTIQTPVVGTALTVSTTSNVGVGSTFIDVVGITSIFGGDLIKIDNEIMLVTSVNGDANKIFVNRAWMGTTEESHSTNSIVTKQSGTINVVDNYLHLPEAPWGNLPIGFGTTAQSSNEIDYSGLTTSSRFSGRVFLRSALTEAFTTSFTKAYDNNYVYDDISDQFNGINTTFTLKYEGNDIDNIFATNTIILINDIFQGPQRLGNVVTNIAGDYKLESSGGQLTLGFNGEYRDPSVTGDVNVNNVPRGGIIVNIASTEGFGYQPLVAAGGTALVSSAGTISAISIGNSGSGYREGIQTVKVGIQTASLGAANVSYIGIATVSDGHVTGVAITNPKVFYAPKQISNIGYSSITGVTTVVTTTPHGLFLGEEVKIVGAAFTCDYYPPLDVDNALYDNTTGIMTVTVGVNTLNVSDFIYDNISGLATITTIEPHKIVPQTAIGRSFSLAGLALTCVGYGQTFAVYDFQYDNITGLATVITSGDHGLTTSANFKMRELTFECPIGGATGYGQTFAITQFRYDNTTGLATVTTNSPIIGVIGIGSDVRLNNLEFSCPFGSGITTSIFPDGTQGYTFTVTNVIASDQFELNVGISTIQHTYVENDAGQVTAGLTTSVFPDGSQGYFFNVNSVGTTTSFTTNVGPSSISHTYVSGGVIQVGINTNIFPGDASVSPLGDTFSVISAPDGYTLTFNAGVSTITHSYLSGGTLTFGHKLKVGTDVALTGLAFTCSYDGGVGILTHPRESDPIYCGTQVTRINNVSEFEINAGISTAESFYTSGGIVEEIITAPRQINNSPTGQDPSANGTSIVKIVDDYTFIINSGPSPYAHFYKRCGTVNKPLDVVFDSPLSYYNIPLIYSSSSTAGFGSGATVDIVVGQGSSIINFEISNFGYGYGSEEVLTVAIGGTTGIPTTSSTNYKEFQLTVGETYQSKFSGWNVGEFIVLDDISRFFNGRRRLFPLSFNGESISFFARANSGINLQSPFLVFVNDVLQTPGEGYQFTGGSTLRFTEAPKGRTTGFSKE